MEALVAIGVVVFFVGLVVYGLRRKGQLERQAEAAMVAEYGESIDVIDPRAVYYGLESKGALQPHELGGTLVITAEQFRFKTWDYGSFLGAETGADVTVETKRITGFGMRNRFASNPMGKIHGKGALVVTYTDAAERSDAIAVALAVDHHEVLQLLESTTGLSRTTD